MKYIPIFLFLMIVWLVISSPSMESTLFGLVISLLLSFTLKDSISLRTLIWFLYSYLKNIPKSISQALELAFKIKRRFIRRILEISASEQLEEGIMAIKMLTITLTPKTIAFDFSENIIFVHEVFYENN